MTDSPFEEAKIPWMCNSVGCHNPKEGRTDHCSSCNKAQRKQERIASQPSKPLTGLRRSGKPKPVSDKRKTEMKDYATLRKDYLKENPVCEANLRVCTGNATEVHHRAKRGKNYLNKETFMSTCHECHVMIETVLSAEDRRNMGFLMTVTDKPTI